MQFHSPSKPNRAVARVTACALLAVLVLSPSVSAQGKKPIEESGNFGNSQVLPPGSHAYGMTMADWTIRWWQWAYSIPVDQNPLFDETGALCGVGQSGPVWFLGGIFNVTGTAHRTECAVPPGKALFFPILNVEWDNGCPPGDLTIPQLRELAKGFADLAINLTCTVDGDAVNDVAAYRYASDPFSITLPDNNIWQLFGCDAPAGTYYPAVGDGYYIMLAPLPPGPHTIHFSGEFSGIFALDITYDLVVGTGESTAAGDLRGAGDSAPVGVERATWGRVKATYR